MKEESAISRGWRMQRLESLIDRFEAGVSVNGENRPAHSDEIGVLKISAVTNGEFRPIENKVVLGKERSRVALSPKRDRLIMSRANTPELVGAVAYVDRDHPKIFLSDKLWQFEPRIGCHFSMRWLGHVLGSTTYRRKLRELATGSSQSMKNLSQESVMRLQIAVPSLSEQHAIAGALDTWSISIEKTERLIALNAQLLGTLRASLGGRRSAKRTRLSAITHESMTRNNARLGRSSIMAVTKQVGMRPMREETIATATDRYKVVRPAAFAYNPMRLNIGSIAMSGFDVDVLVSPDYVVFECDESRLLPGYLNHLRRTPAWASYFASAGSGGVRVRIYYDDLGAFSFVLPSLKEQERAIRLLDACDAEIDALRRYADSLKKQKRGLMQKLVTGQWRINARESAAI